MQDREQFTRLTETYMDTVYRVALNYLRSPDQAEDICQEVFLRLFRTKESFADEAHVKYWLIHVALNECKRTLGAPWRKDAPLDGTEREPVFSEPALSDTYQAVMALPRKYRVAIYLHYYEGYSAREIARMLRCTTSTVTTRLSRGRKLLKEMLSEDAK